MAKFTMFVRTFYVVCFYMVWCLVCASEGSLIQINGRRVYRIGAQMVLNCTTTSKQFTNDHLYWTKDDKPLLGKKLVNNTLQLIVPNVKAADGGRYRCAIIQQSRLIRSLLIYISVGDVPAKPKNISWRNVNWRICVIWYPVSSTGGFPVTYRVRYRCVKDCQQDDLDYDDVEVDSFNKRWHVGCKNFPQRPGQKHHCCLRFVDLFSKYEAVVIATNLLGSSSSQPFNFVRDLKTAPSPPSSLKLKAEGFGEITIQWSMSDWMYWKTKYRINYNAQGDTKNKTIVTYDNGQRLYRITGLEPYTKYTVYVAVFDSISNIVGTAAGPVSIVTREELPSSAPVITRWNEVTYPENKSLRNVTIHWKLPPKQSWNGKITKYIVHYRKHVIMKYSPGHQIEIDNSSASEATIVGIRVDSSYEVEMKMCNIAGCGGIGTRVVFNGRGRLVDTRRPVKVLDNTTTVLICILTAAVVICFIATIITIIKAKRKKKFINVNLDILNSPKL